MLNPQDGVGSIDTLSVEPVAAIAGEGMYEAIRQTKRRRQAPTRVVREDTVLKNGGARGRDKLAASTQDLVRNFAIAGWMIRRHLDYVSLFDFHARNATTKNLVERYGQESMDRLDDDIERLMAEDSTANRCDAGGRFKREKLFRIAELKRTIDGDCFLALLRSGHLQGIESDLVRDPDPTTIRAQQLGNRAEWVDGVRIGSAGRPSSFAVHRRKSGGRNYEFAREIPAARMLHYGYFGRFAGDQVRGVSPVTAGINDFRDCFEMVDYAKAKGKVAQLFAFAVFNQGTDHTSESVTETETKDSDGNVTGKRYDVDFGAGPVHLELDQGDRAEFLESKTPSTELQQFVRLVLAIGLKSLDIPYSFFDEGHTNFFGSRGAWLHYERAALDKRDDQIEMRRAYTIWKLRQFVMSGRLVLPAGMSLAEVSTEWVPRGMPWWDPAKEIRGDKEAIGAGLDNPERICKRTGNGDVRDNIRATIRTLKFAREESERVLGDPDAYRLDFGVQPEITLATSEDQRGNQA